MADAIVVKQPTTIEGFIPPTPQIHLVATNPQEMASANENLQAWLRAKIDSLRGDIAELELAKDEAKRHKWKHSTFNNQLRKCHARKQFYQKTLEAVIAGYTIVPNFPVDVFAVRVTRDKPTSGTQYNYGYSAAQYLSELPDIAPAGEGEYKSTKPDGCHWTDSETMRDGTKRDKNYFEPTELAAVEFPFSVARTEVMSATAQAMALRVFDEIGVCPQPRRARGKGDPLIIGRVCLDATRNSEFGTAVSFLIAWHLDLRTL